MSPDYDMKLVYTTVSIIHRLFLLASEAHCGFTSLPKYVITIPLVLKLIIENREIHRLDVSLPIGSSIS